jgi:hypothetical protein
MPSADAWGCVSYGNFEMRWVYESARQRDEPSMLLVYFAF